MRLAEESKLARRSAAGKGIEDLRKDHNDLQLNHAKIVDAFSSLQMYHDELQQLQKVTQKQLEDLKDQDLSSQQAQVSSKVDIIDTRLASL